MTTADFELTNVTDTTAYFSINSKRAAKLFGTDKVDFSRAMAPSFINSMEAEGYSFGLNTAVFAGTLSEFAAMQQGVM